MAKRKEKKQEQPEASAADELEIITATPQVLKNSEGKEYKLFPLGIAAMAELRVWAKARVKEELKETLKLLGKDAPPAVIARAWDDAYKELRDPMTSPAVESPDAIAHWILISIKKGDDSVTAEEVGDLIKDRGIKELFIVLMTLNGITKDALENPQVARLLESRRHGS